MASSDAPKMGWNATWAMAVGGMIGGGIFSVLGLVIDEAGSLAWLSLVLAGLVALATAYSYVALTRQFGEGGGAFLFLRKAGLKDAAGTLSWVLVIGYVLTISVYAFTFARYVGQAVGLEDPVLVRLASVAIIATLLVVNLRGVGDSSRLEIFLVWGKVAVLIGLAAFGLARWAPDELSHGVDNPSAVGVVVAAASIFMAYEGFQLLTYDYDEIRDADRTLPQAVLAAVASVIVIYVAVGVGATMLIGAGSLAAEREVGLAIAGQEAWGRTGNLIVSMAALFSAGSAINATLFATARLSKRIAEDGELPRFAAHVNQQNVPDRAVISLAVIAALFASIGSLSALVDAASLTFLATFLAVNTIATFRLEKHRAIAATGAGGAAIGLALLTGHLALEQPWVLAFLGGIVIFALTGRQAVRCHFAGS